MGYWGNIKIDRGTFYSGSTNSTPLAAGATWAPYQNYRGILWGAFIMVDAATDSHLDTFGIKINDSGAEVIMPYQYSFEECDRYDFDSEYIELTNYSVDGDCSIQYWFPFGIPVESKLELHIKNESAVNHDVRTFTWREVY